MIVIVLATFDSQEDAEEVMAELEADGIQSVGLVIDDEVNVLQ